MRLRMGTVGTSLGLALSLAVGLAAMNAAGPKQALPVGSIAPAWNKLPGADGNSHSLADLAGAKLVVVAFTCNSCPYATAYEDRFIAFAKKYADRGVRFVAVSVNTEDEDKLPAMKSRAELKAFPFPYLHDASQKIGFAFGARVTPHLFLLDADRKIAYAGAFDDAKNPDRVEHRHLESAVDALLAGQKPKTAETRATGCTIHYD